jgi:hypothetical protein
MELRGPCTYILRNRSFRNIKNPEILDACIELSGEVIPLQQNNVWVDRFPDTLYVYHCFQYHDNDGNLVGGRWTSRSLPLDAFTTIKRMFRREIMDDQGRTAIIRVIFTEKIAEELRAIS